VLARHFPGGAGSPALLVVQETDAERALQVVRSVKGVASAQVTSDPRLATPTQPAPPKVVDGQVEIEATLSAAADSPAAEETVQRLRAAVDQVGQDVLVGGTTAVNLDVRDSSRRDLLVIIPAILVVILLVLMLLLRSVVAPLLLIAANVLSFGATIGVSALVFNDVLGFPGGDPSIPLYGFVFLVALGIDYSIFLMTRVREESLDRGTRTGVLTGLAVTGGVITSAGVVLAATFGALATLPLLFLQQIAFIVAFGVLLDTLVVRSLLVPALARDLGGRVWWPNRLAADRGDVDEREVSGTISA
jgi:RND superfamily putative drug exporter